MLFMLFIMAAGFLTSCGDNGVSREELMKFYAKSDSLRQEYQMLQADFQNTQSMHQQFLAQVQGMATPDSTALEELQRHEVMLQGIAANFTKVQELFTAHDTFRQQQEGGTLTGEELKGQLDAMKDDHDEINKTLDDISSELDDIRNDHEELQQDLMNQETETTN